MIHTQDHHNCPACERYRLRVLDPEAFAQLTFSQAAPAWLDEMRSQIAPKTYTEYCYYARSLGRFFGSMKLSDVRWWHVKAYQDERQQPAEKQKGAGPALVNHEINAVLKPILRRAGMWAAIREHYRPLKAQPSRIGRALEPPEEKRLLEAGASNSRWNVAYFGSIIQATTTADSKEITNLRVRDIDLRRREFNFHDGVKNKFRVRTVYMNDAGLFAAKQLLDRYHRHCRRRHIESHPDHFVLWKRGGSPFEPMVSWRKAWRGMRERAGLEGFRRKDLRHHATTKIAERAGLSETQIIEITGHKDTQMLKVYAHARQGVRRRAAEALELSLPAICAKNSPSPPAFAGD